MDRCNRIAWLILFLILASCGGGSGGGSGGTPTPPAANQPPVFQSAAAGVYEEHGTQTAYEVVVSDAEGDAMTVTIGGVDAALFEISGLMVSFLTSPDFEAPGDANGDNAYQITLSATDGETTTTLDVTITVTDRINEFGVRRVASGINQPIQIVGTGEGRAYVVTKPGVINVLDPATGVLSASPFLDITDEVVTDGEYGLLGMATTLNYPDDPTFYIHFSRVPDGDGEIRRYTATTIDQADTSSGETILIVPQPDQFVNHNGGWLGFDDAGLLYIALGDGGGGGDPLENGQDTSTWLGSMLRIDPSVDDFPADADRNYGIPVGNPFIGTPGLDEIFAYGLRNPFRASFDPLTGFLYIGDVGQGEREEIDLLRPTDAGANYGWNAVEGTLDFDEGADPGFTPPVLEYEHGSGDREGSSVIGGIVYRGPATQLVGEYIYGDFISGGLWSIPADDLVQGSTLTNMDATVRTTEFQPDVGVIDALVSLDVDAAGNLYFVDIDGEIFYLEAF
ncbi:MAG: PQQ-dependent sugar dehydrogenase [Pseudomonadota bacterium]